MKIQFHYTSSLNNVVKSFLKNQCQMTVSCLVSDSLKKIQRYIYKRQTTSSTSCSQPSMDLPSLFFIIVSTAFSCMEIFLYSLKFHSSVWEPFYELKLYLPLPRLPRTFCVWTESLTGVHLFHILVSLKLLGEYHLVLATCYDSCYWFFLHKNVQKTSLCQTEGLSTSLSFLANTRCLGKIIRRKGVMIVSLNSPLAFNHLWLGDCQSLSGLLILKLLMIFFSTNIILVEEKAGLIFHICRICGKK